MIKIRIVLIKLFLKKFDTFKNLDNFVLIFVDLSFKSLNH